MRPARVARLTVQAFRIGFAFAAGMLWRYARKLAGRPPRIWHGFMPLHTIPDRVQQDRKLGYPARSVVLHTAASRKYAQVKEKQFDVVLSTTDVPADMRHWAVLRDLMLHADIWNAQFDCLFVPYNEPEKNERAFRLLRRAGVRIIVSVHGSDVLQYSDTPGRYDWVRRASLDYPNWDFDTQTLVSRERIRIFSKYADLVLPGDPTIVPWLPRHDVLFKYFPMDTEAIRPVPVPPHDVPVIVHAPNHRHAKGTQYLIDAVDALHAAGFACELRLVERVEREEAMRMYAEADIAADQFIIGSFGSFALEAAALAKPVLTYLEPAHLTNPVYNLPLVNTTPENVRDVLAPLVTIPELRQRLGDAARMAVAMYYSYDAIGEVWDRMYRHVWHHEPLDLRSTRHFDPARGIRSLSEDPADPAFWPVEVGDLMPEIQAAVQTARRV